MDLSLRTWVVTLVLAFPAPALAQPSVALFIEAGPMLNKDMTWGGQQVRNEGINVSGGVRIGRRTEVRILLERPPTTTLTSSHEAYSGMPPVLSARVTTRARVRNQTVAVTVGRLFPVGTRYTVTTLLGFSESRRGEGATIIVENLASGAKVEEESDSRGPEWAGPVFGVGAIVAITKHLSLVPETRLIWYVAAENGSTIVRAALNARWTF